MNIKSSELSQAVKEKNRLVISKLASITEMKGDDPLIALFRLYLLRVIINGG